MICVVAGVVKEEEENRGESLAEKKDRFNNNKFFVNIFKFNL